MGFALLAAITKSVTNALVAGVGRASSPPGSSTRCAWWDSGRSVIMQSAFQVGPFAASQSTLILVNPLVAIRRSATCSTARRCAGARSTRRSRCSRWSTMIAGALGLSYVGARRERPRRQSGACTCSRAGALRASGAASDSTYSEIRGTGLVVAFRAVGSSRAGRLHRPRAHLRPQCAGLPRQRGRRGRRPSSTPSEERRRQRQT